MLRQLDSRQLAEMYAYCRIERNPVSEEEKAAERARQLRAAFEGASKINDRLHLRG